MMTALQKFLVAAFSLTSIICRADDPEITTLPVISVIGQPEGLSPLTLVFTLSGAFYSDPPGFTPTNQWLVQRSQMIQALHAFTDVRCTAGGDRKRTTSLDDLTNRWLAAQDVYQKLRLMSPGMQSMILKQAISTATGQSGFSFPVVYADGGTEKWFAIPSSMPSIQVLDDPQTGTLVKADGVLRPSPTGCSPTP